MDTSGEPSMAEKTAGVVFAKAKDLYEKSKEKLGFDNKSVEEEQARLREAAEREAAEAAAREAARLEEEQILAQKAHEKAE